MKSYITSKLELVISASRKLAIGLFAGIALIAGIFTETILAGDAPQKSKGPHAQITQSQAERIALAKVPGGKVKAAKLAPENGELIWSVDIMTPLTKKIVAVEVDAESGKVLSKLKETPGDRAEDSALGQKNGQ
jgi:Peptidase propeptide and YPEB domain